MTRPRPRSRQAREPVRAPALAPPPVMDEEEPVGVVALLAREEARVVRAPVGLLPGFLEEVALGHVRACGGRYPPDLPHRALDRGGARARAGHVGLAPSDARGRGPPLAPSGSYPRMPGYAGGPSAPLMRSANASSTAGLVAVSRAAATSSAGGAASPLFACG